MAFGAAQKLETIRSRRYSSVLGMCWSNRQNKSAGADGMGAVEHESGHG